MLCADVAASEGERARRPAQGTIDHGDADHVSHVVPTAVASTSLGHCQGGGVLPSSGKAVKVAVRSVVANKVEAHGSSTLVRKMPGQSPKADP